ncbi:MAG: amino acid permease, partial [Phycisphaerae bacterium]|nr:amino acid permease [Phycisphaerae bacterium]
MAVLKKQLGFLGVFSVATGAMISSGLFILPAIAYQKAGPAVILSYLIASIIILPTVLTKAELATAMPRAGGTYFYVERSFGPILGLFSGLANWFSLALKSAFAIIGMAIFAAMAFNCQDNEIAIKAIAAGCCVFFTIINIISVKYTGRFQVLFVAILLAILALFAFLGSMNIREGMFSGFMAKGFSQILATAGLVFISYGGITKVASIAEEVKNPGKNITQGMLASWFVVSIFYIAVVTVAVGVLSPQEISQSLTPLSTAASAFMGKTGFILLTVAAIAAFITTANGGILAASRSPMSMSRDQLLPKSLASINHRFQTPHVSIIITSVFMIIAVVSFNLEVLVKTASTLLLILYILDNASVIIMRESKIQSYRPQFKSPLYPYLQIFSIIAYSVLILDMGKTPLLICGGFVVASTAWYFLYASKKAGRASAVMHIVERVTDIEMKTVTLENELRDILIERDQIIEDRFDKLVRECGIIDLETRQDSESVFKQISAILSSKLDTNEYVLLEKFLAREAQGGTIVQPGLAIPHIVVDGENKFEIILVRAKKGIV